MAGRPEERASAGLQGIFEDIFPVKSHDGSVVLEFVNYSFGPPKYSINECQRRGLTFSRPLKARLKLVVHESHGEEGEVTPGTMLEQDVFLGDLPIMTESGTFIINGAERVVVSQLHKSPGVSFEEKLHQSGRKLLAARVIPYRGAWLEFEYDINEVMYMQIDRRSKLLATIILRAIGYETDEEIIGLFFDTVEVELAQKTVLMGDRHVPVRRILGSKLAKDVECPDTKNPDKKKKIVAHKKTELTKKVLDELRENKIKVLTVSDAPNLAPEGGDREKIELELEETTVKIVTKPKKRKRIPIEEISGTEAPGILAADVINTETGEIIAESKTLVTPPLLDEIRENGIKKLRLVSLESEAQDISIITTLQHDETASEEDALIEIYRHMRPGDPATIGTARTLFNRLFFDQARYFLAPVGRYKINRKLNIDVPIGVQTLSKEDVVATLRYLVGLKNGKGMLDDIDHLGNRRVRSVGELLANQVRIGLVRMERTIRERMNFQDTATLTPQTLVNPKPVSAVIKDFFGRSQLSHFMDQTNPLAELTHQRRLSALGPGGLSRDRATFEVRDVHLTHYGRICPIETPEGPNIGLMASLSTYARVNEYGFIETPYRKVKRGRVTHQIEYLSAYDEGRYTIAQANSPIDAKGRFTSETVLARYQNEYPEVSPEAVDYMDVSPKQLVSVATALVPFLEHDDANRALMGSNMQRQAVPLLTSEAPLIGTGMESIVARNSGAVVLAKHSGVVEYVDAEMIVIRHTGRRNMDADPFGMGEDVYRLKKFVRSNQNTCINQRPIVREGQKVKADQAIADGSATDHEELALGKNLLVAFMPWEGYNFEDAILMSEKVIKDDIFTSVHIEVFETEARDTKLGPEEITRDIPSVSEEALKDLDEEGVIRVGAEVRPGDILVGKVTPKGETELAPEEKLLRAIFGEKAEDVKDASMVVRPGVEGVVVDVQVFSRKERPRDKESRTALNREVARAEQEYGERIERITDRAKKLLKEMLVGCGIENDVADRATGDLLFKAGLKVRQKHFSGTLDLNKLRALDTLRVSDAKTDAKRGALVARAISEVEKLESLRDSKITNLKKGDELLPGVNKKVRVFVATKRKLSVGDKIAGRHGNKGVVAKILPEEDMPFLPDGTPVEIVLNPLGVPSRMNVGQILETHLGWAAKELGVTFASPVFSGAPESEIAEYLGKAGLPESGKIMLFDGRTGEPFDREVTVGNMYMMKLIHLVDDKIHARAIGPYSLVTQQPLGGKAQRGGQRFGEMEVWALQAYGAAHTLQEMLTIKSDDVAGRTKAYEGIVKGEKELEAGTPESFNVLVKELQSLCLNVGKWVKVDGDADGLGIEEE